MQNLKARSLDALLIGAALYNLAELLQVIDGPQWVGPVSLAVIAGVLFASVRTSRRDTA